jgi:hypothetical protein
MDTVAITSSSIVDTIWQALGPIFGLSKHSRPKITASILTSFSELLPNLYYSPIKKLENIFIFKIARQQHP